MLTIALADVLSIVMMNVSFPSSATLSSTTSNVKSMQPLFSGASTVTNARLPKSVSTYALKILINN